MFLIGWRALIVFLLAKEFEFELNKSHNPEDQFWREQILRLVPEKKFDQHMLLLFCIPSITGGHVHPFSSLLENCPYASTICTITAYANSAA